MKSSLNVSISPCPNDTFAFGYLIEGLLEWEGPILNFEFLDIQALNQRGLGTAPPDVLKFSYACWPQLQERYDLLRVGSALGFGVGPLIVGAGTKPLEDRDCLLIPGTNTTAAALARRYFPQMKTTSVSYEKIMTRLQNKDTEAGVIIHESRFTFQEQGLIELFDLGAHWEEDTGLPLPLGGIAILKKHRQTLAPSLEETLRTSIDRAKADHSSILSMMQKHAQEMSEDIMKGHIELYVNEETRSLSPHGEKAIQSLCNLNTLDFAV